MSIHESRKQADDRANAVARYNGLSPDKHVAEHDYAWMEQHVLEQGKTPSPGLKNEAARQRASEADYNRRLKEDFDPNQSDWRGVIDSLGNLL